MNDAKSVPFMYMVKAKNPCIPPKKSKSPRFSKLHEIRQPFFDLDHEKWKPQILQRIAQNPLNSPAHTANHAKLAQFTLISKIPCSLSKTAIFTVNYAKSAQFANPYSESRGISQIRTIFNYSSNFVFRHS